MNQKEYLVKTEIIRKTFSDERKIKCQTPTEDLKHTTDMMCLSSGGSAARHRSHRIRRCGVLRHAL